MIRPTRRAASNQTRIRGPDAGRGADARREGGGGKEGMFDVAPRLRDTLTRGFLVFD